MEPLDVTVSAYLERPVSDEGKNARFFAKGGVYRTFSIFCEKGKSQCKLWIYDMSDEYCNGKSVPHSQYTAGFNYNNFDTIVINRSDNVITFEFDDLILYGSTHNAIKITLDPKIMAPDGQSVPSHVDGIASALNTTQGAPLQSRYREISTPIVCSLGFFPPGT